jgi:riboflavin synthase
MFTGIIKNTTKIVSSKKKNGSLFLEFKIPSKWKLEEGESISTNGVCLTVKEIGKNSYIAELMPETLKNSTFGILTPGKVNLERSLKLGEMISGHFVTGHIDTIGEIKEIQKEGLAKIFTISFPQKFSKLITTKGSICVDGISLTVTKKTRNSFSVATLKYTLDNTNLGVLKKGDVVNLEFDILAKYLINH